MIPDVTNIMGGEKETAAPVMKRVTSKGKLTESKSLESEAKDLLARVGASGVGRRCAEYSPTLDELKSTTFSDYIRGEVLGVPLPGYEFLYIHEDEQGRERKRVVPTGQVPPPSIISAKAGDSGISISSSSQGNNNSSVQEARRTRSQSKAIESVKEGALLSETLPPKAGSMYRPKKYQMCWHKLRGGIAKISLPTGFWAKTDSTARGRHWAKGAKLGDTIIPSPIKQAISGIGGVYEYTLLEQPPIAVADFRTQADEYRKRHMGKEFDEDHSDEFCDALAHKFWKRLGPTMEAATYGADMEGSLFKDAHACGWNVDRLESCLCLLGADANEGECDDDKIFHVPGVTSSYLYFGMWASAFAAHNEDMNLLSINYLHAGSPKYWYAIAHEDSKRFESLARSHFSGPASVCNEFLRHKMYVLSPAILKKAGIKFTTCVQRPGDAIITFPGSYHFGFNTGFNIAESTNFAVPEWIPLGEAARVCMCHPHSVRINMKRLKYLLDRYEKDMCFRESVGLSKMTYSNWAKHEAKRIKKSMKMSGNNKVLTNGGSGDKNPPELPSALNTSTAVEVTKESVSPKKKSKKRSYREYNEWHLAKRVRPSLFVPNTAVLCMVECEDGDGLLSTDRKHEFFMGNVVTIVDGHVKVNFIGQGKKEALWFEHGSDCLFLDGGLTDPPST